MTAEASAAEHWLVVLAWVWLLLPSPLLIWLAFKGRAARPPLRGLLGFGALWALAGLVLGSQVIAHEAPGVLPLTAGFAQWLRSQLSNVWVLFGLGVLIWLVAHPPSAAWLEPVARRVRTVKVASVEIALDTPEAAVPGAVTAAAFAVWSAQGGSRLEATLGARAGTPETDLRKFDADGQILGERPVVPPVAYAQFLEALPAILDAMPLEPGDAAQKWFTHEILDREAAWAGEYAEELRLTAFGILERFRAQPLTKGRSHRLGDQVGRSVMVRALMLVGHGDPGSAARLVESLGAFEDDVVEGLLGRDLVCRVLVALARERSVRQLETLLAAAKRLRVETTFEGRTASVAASLAAWLAWVAGRPAPIAEEVMPSGLPSWRGHDLLAQAAQAAMAARDRDHHRAMRLALALLARQHCPDAGALEVARTIGRRTLALSWGACSMHEALQRFVATDPEAAADPMVLHVAALSLQATGHKETAGRLLREAHRKAREQGDTASAERLAPLVAALDGG